MNHIYRLIWNTTLACWVVASEHTRSRGKRTRTVRAAAAALALALPLAALASDEDRTTEEETVSASDFTTALLRLNNEVLLRSAAPGVAPLALNRALEASVNDPYFTFAALRGENSLVLGSRASVTGNRSTGIGNEVVINGGGHTVVGSKAIATGGRDAVAIGINAFAAGVGNVSIGEAARTETGGGKHAVAIGAVARAGTPGWTGAVALGGGATAAYDGVGMGYMASALNAGTVAVGLRATATAQGAVALGASSVATTSNTVSVGSATLKRKIVNVADGALAAASTDVVTGRQLFATNQNVVTATNTANAAKTNANTARIDATAALSKANAVAGLIGQTSAAGNVRVGAENTGTVLDVRNKSTANRAITGVANGALSATSTEAVTGKQLFATNQNVTTATNTANTARTTADAAKVDATAALTKANLVSGLIGQVSAAGNVRVGAENTGTVLDVRNKANANRAITGVADGALSAASSEAVSGRQLFGTNERVEYLEQQQRYVMVGADEFSGPAMAGPLAVAIGSDAKAPVDGATAIGSFASAQAVNSVALGRGALVRAAAEAGFALGTNTEVAAAGGLAIGALSSVGAGANRAVALGNESVANENDTISVGNDNLKRRIVNVGRGTAEDNVTTVAQLSETLTALGGGAGLDATGVVISPNYVLSGGEFNNVGDALTSLDTTLISHKSELDTLDSRYQSLVQNDRSIRYNEDRSVVDFGGATVTGVAKGKLSADSSDAVNGGQLFGTNERVEYLEQQQRYVMVVGDQFSEPAQAGNLGVAVGGDAEAGDEGATAVGSFATAKGRNSVALGRAAYVAPEGRDGFALGTRTRVQAAGGMAIGADSDVIAGADKSVALGNASVATEANTVSVGSGEYRRRIVNVGQGIHASDATTVSQLRGTLAALGGGADLDANGNVIGPRYAVQGSEYGSFGDALTALDGTVGDNKRGLDGLDNRFQRLFQETPSASADAPGRLSLGGAQGMVLGNVANGLVGQGSRDAVNGGQLWQVKQDLLGQIDALDPNGQGGTPVAINARSATVASDAPPAPEADTPPATPDAVVTAEGDSAVAVGSEGKERAVKHVAEGRADTDAANVRQLNDAMERANEYTDAAVAGVNQRLDHMDKRINRMAAINSAQSAMAMNTAGLATTNRLGAGVGYAEGESALSVGYQRVLNERGSATFSLNGAFTNSGERSVGVGMGIGW